MFGKGTKRQSSKGDGRQLPAPPTRTQSAASEVRAGGPKSSHPVTLAQQNSTSSADPNPDPLGDFPGLNGIQNCRWASVCYPLRCLGWFP